MIDLETFILCELLYFIDLCRQYPQRYSPGGFSNCRLSNTRVTAEDPCSTMLTAPKPFEETDEAGMAEVGAEEYKYKKFQLKDLFTKPKYIRSSTFSRS
jgi:hypothetical protein